MKKMLLASTSTIYGQKYLEYLHDEIKNLFSGCKKILFVPYARPSGISHLEYTEKAKNVFKILNLEIIDYTNEDLRESLEKCDGIFAGGGNTFLLLNKLYQYSLIDILKNKINSGIPYLGTSAGAICWFEKGITDSFAKELNIIDCLGIVDGIACPHFDEEKEREPYVNDVINREIIKSCICIEGNCAVHVKNNIEYSAIDFGNGKKCFRVYKENNTLKKEIL